MTYRGLAIRDNGVEPFLPTFSSGFRINLLVVFLLITAGCAESADQGVTPTESEASNQPETPSVATTPTTPTTTETETSTATPTTTATPTPRPPDNPWGKDPIIVSVDNEVGYEIRSEDVFEDALRYWEAHDRNFTHYQLDFEFNMHSTSPDIVIEYVRELDECGEADEPGPILGCAPLGVNQSNPEPVRIQIRETNDEAELLNTVKHEFGHVLGIRHGEQPMPLMSASDLYWRAAPWDDGNITYYVDPSTPGVSRSNVEEEITVALSYFESGAEGNLVTAPDFTRVSSRSEANIIIDIHQRPRSSDGFVGSTARNWYSGYVGDQFYRTYTISVYDVETTGPMSWHIAYWIAQSVVGPGDTYPSVLISENCDAHCRHGEWWT